MSPHQLFDYILSGGLAIVFVLFIAKIWLTL